MMLKLFSKRIVRDENMECYVFFISNMLVYCIPILIGFCKECHVSYAVVTLFVISFFFLYSYILTCCTAFGPAGKAVEIKIFGY